jgi:hypothetical protein
MVIGPVEFSGFMNQGHDVNKVAGHESSKVHDQMAQILKAELEKEKDKTHQIDEAAELEVTDDEHASAGEHEYKSTEDDGDDVSDNADDDVEIIDLVKFDDPDLGHNYDWQG